MAEIVNIVVALAVIYFVVRWATRANGEESPEQTAVRALRFKPKRVTPQMIDTVVTMFPDLPRANIHYDLLRTGSTELTATKILEKGFLEAPPPAYFTLYPGPASPQPVASTHAVGTASSSARPAKPRETLIQRFNLDQQVSNARGASVDEKGVGGKAIWEDTAEKREASLRERKQKMILAARQCVLLYFDYRAGSDRVRADGCLPNSRSRREQRSRHSADDIR
ncbi:hypothetical protein K488DRAFT_54994 [Vararia minispora EC-137]|uniref:Uncharacterized protein n=1 Tax=Vararia minispora EC-137 TaxID=1314806 RepID=A0ACB8QE46_9AGAM|nr:hypothetical protein K488DRAFT_54994 [Vararia minispora EC-137]